LLRLVFFLLLAYIVWLVVRAYLAGGMARRSRAASIDKGEEMVLDPQCLSYVPKNEAVFRNDRYFCSEDCAKRYLTKG
jgi:hypothetical protein